MGQTLKMQNGPKHIVYLVGTSTATRGGIGYVIGAYLNSDLQNQFRLVHVVTHRDGSCLLKIWTYAKALVRFVFLRLTLGGRLVHIHSSDGFSFWRKALLLFLGKGLGCRVIFQIHSGEFLDFYRAQGSASQSFIRRVLRTADQIVVLTNSWKQKIGSFIASPAKITVVGNPVDTLKYKPCQRANSPPTAPRALFLGILVKAKGVYDIVECLRLLKEQGLLMRATLAGDREIDQVRTASKKAGVEEFIHLPGWVSEPTKLELLKASDMLLLPSYAEGLPLCVLEAMACGLPIVCTNVGGLPDLVTDGENGLLLASGDVPALARSVAKLAKDSSLRQRMGLRNLQKVQNEYSLRAIGQRIGGLYWTTLQ